MDQSTCLTRWREITKNIESTERQAGRKAGDVNLVTVSKNFPVETIEPLIRAGQRLFGENRVQEAKSKWTQLKQRYPNIELHLIGPLQSNKAAEAVALFDWIETVDRPKIAEAISVEIHRQQKPTKLMVQVNTGAEPQKAGVLPHELEKFLLQCNRLDLPVVGLMCIPPIDEEPSLHFALLAKLASENGLKMLSMGMSGDFEKAIRMGSTHVRVGTAIFGSR